MSNEQIVKYIEAQDRKAMKEAYKKFAYCLRYLDEIEGEIMKGRLLQNNTFRMKIHLMHTAVKELEEHVKKLK